MGVFNWLFKQIFRLILFPIKLLFSIIKGIIIYIAIRVAVLTLLVMVVLYFIAPGMLPFLDNNESMDVENENLTKIENKTMNKIENKTMTSMENMIDSMIGTTYVPKMFKLKVPDNYIW
jgi:uncharacterized membrane protein